MNMGKKREDINKGMKRPYRRCGEKFIPLGKFAKYCNDCCEKSKERGRLRRIRKTLR